MRHRRCLAITTPEGSGQAVHPDVLEVPAGHLGYRYWMACTPYPFGDDRHENPVLRVSHDGINWQRLIGAPDPLVPAPEQADWHHADTDLVLHEGVLHVYYITTQCEGARTVFSVITSRDGVHWTAPQVVYRAAWGVSPAVLVHMGNWYLWYVWRDTNSTDPRSSLRLRSGTSAFEFGGDRRCELELPGMEVWHIDVIADGDAFEALVAAFPTGTDPSRSRVFHVRSSDGLRFVPTSTAPLISPSWFGWDDRMVYRSTMVRRDDGGYRVWYSAASWGMRCGIGLLEGPIDSLQDQGGAVHGAGVPVTRRLAEDLAGAAKYVVSRLLSPAAYRRLLLARNRVRHLLGGAR